MSHPRPVITSTAPQINTTPQPTALLADEQALIRTSQITGISLPVLMNNIQLDPLNEHAHPLVTQEQVVTVNTKPSGTLQLTIQSMDDMEEFEDCAENEDDWELDLEEGPTVPPFWFENCNLETTVSDWNDDDSCEKDVSEKTHPSPKNIVDHSLFLTHSNPCFEDISTRYVGRSAWWSLYF